MQTILFEAPTCNIHLFDLRQHKTNGSECRFLDCFTSQSCPIFLSGKDSKCMEAHQNLKGAVNGL